MTQLEALQELSTSRLLDLQSAALSATPQAIAITDRNRRIEWVNPGFSELTGYTLDEARGQHITGLLRGGAQDEGPDTAIETWRGEVTNRHKSGKVLTVSQTITPVRDEEGRITHFVMVEQDLTEQRSLEAQFLQAQKMEVVGRLAGGIAHDFNNLLTVINGTAELALTDLGADHPMKSDFERIQEAGRRAAALTRQLLSFSRKQNTQRELVAAGALIKDLERMIQRLIGADIEFEVCNHAGDSAVCIDRAQLEQVILNLVVNARDAMPHGGALGIEIDNVDLDAASTPMVDGMKPGPHLRITVADSGEGMTTEVMARVFEPFFTTKESGKGTGLGLATVYAIVAHSGGTVRVSSEVGRGTSFTILLPSVGSLRDCPPEEAEPLLKATGTVLLVEHDASLRELAVRILRTAGYFTLVAGDALGALSAISEHPVPVDLIVSDAALPFLAHGAHAGATMVRHVPVLFTAADADEVAALSRQVGNQTFFIAKPFTVNALTEKVRDILRQARSQPGSRDAQFCSSCH